MIIPQRLNTSHKNLMPLYNYIVKKDTIVLEIININFYKSIILLNHKEDIYELQY